MMTNTVVIDWQSKVVDEWFNSELIGGFIKTVVDKGLYNNLGEIGIINVHSSPLLKKPGIQNSIKTWFKRRIRNIKSRVASGDTRMFVVRGCTAQQTLGLTSRLKKYAHSINPDEDTLIRLVNQFSSRFVNQTPDILFSEKFFSELIDGMFDTCSNSIDKVTFISSEYLNSKELGRIAFDFFPRGTTKIYDETTRDLCDNPSYTIKLVESQAYFNELFNKANIPIDEMDSSESQLVEYAMKEVTETLQKAI